MHVDRENRSVKFWPAPDVLLAENHGFNRTELKGIEQIKRRNLKKLKNEWGAFCSGHTGTD
jgi:hypothetical protein